jgi:hypothetical protein
MDLLAFDPHEGDTMAFKIDNRKMVTTRRLAVVGLVALLALVIILLNHEDDAAQLIPHLTELTDTSARTVQINPPSAREIVSRLGDILRIREEAYRSRSPEYLRWIYSSDCPCLANDEEAILELLDHKYRWRGIATSIEVRSVKRMTDQLWIVVALLKSKALRIEKENGKLVRIEPAGSDLVEFTLVKPHGAKQWLLGLVSDVEVRG